MVIPIHTILTTYRGGFADRIFGLHKAVATGANEFHALCVDLGIKHRPTPSKLHHTDSMFEHFNRCVAEIFNATTLDFGQSLRQRCTTISDFIIGRPRNPPYTEICPADDVWHAQIQTIAVQAKSIQPPEGDIYG